LFSITYRLIIKIYIYFFFRYRNDDLVNVNDSSHYKGGNSENVALVIRSTERDDIGNYSCQLSNTIGKGISDQKINLDVHCKIL